MRLDGCAGTPVAKREKCSEGHTSNRYRTLFHKEMEYAVMKGKPFARRSGKRAFGRRRKTKGAGSGGRNAEGGRPKDADRGGSRNGGKGRAEAAERRAGHRPGTGPRHGGSYGGDEGTIRFHVVVRAKWEPHSIRSGNQPSLWRRVGWREKTPVQGTGVVGLSYLLIIRCYARKYSLMA